MAHDASVAVFLAQLVVLLVTGRLLGELMQRIGQPQVTGQIIAGVLLGPSLLGALAPGPWHALFGGGPEQKAMLDAVAQLGVLLLLLLTGMETDLSVFREARRPALAISLSGIVVPFACGCVLAALMPESLLPAAGRRLTTALFLGTALAISSVKIVALVVRDLGFLRRTVGQTILAASVLDDTIGWVMVSIIFGLAAHGTIDLPVLARSLLGTALFLVLCVTVGRRVVFVVVRWSNDALTSEMATVSTILVITGALALLTYALGVQFVLGAFVAGILIGQSPILTRQLQAQLRALIVALFMPVFFGLVGLSTDLSALAQPRFLWLTAGLIGAASVGKFLGAFIGGRLGGLSYAESFAVGCGMNARGSTEIIVASIGLQIGALNVQLFTAIVAMAVVTTTAMPPMLRWAVRRLPITDAERERLAREEFEAQGFLGQVERLLVAIDASPSGRFASRLAGLLAGARQAPTTVLHLGSGARTAHARDRNSAESADEVAKSAAAAAGQSSTAAGEVQVTTRSAARDTAPNAIATEAEKGYGLLLIGREPTVGRGGFAPLITRSAADFGGPFAIAIARAQHQRAPGSAPLSVLVTVSGTRASRHGAEVAIALAHASHGSVTALHVASRAERSGLWPRALGSALAPRDSAGAAIAEIVALGKHYGTAVHGRIRHGASLPNAVLQELARSGQDLLVMGVTPRPDAQLFLGDTAAQMLERAPCSVLFVCSEPLRESPAPEPG